MAFTYRVNVQDEHHDRTHSVIQPWDYQTEVKCDCESGSQGHAAAKARGSQTNKQGKARLKCRTSVQAEATTPREVQHACTKALGKIN